MGDTWSYTVLRWQRPAGAVSDRATEEALNRRGEDGWELVAVQPNGTKFLYFMKKRSSGPLLADTLQIGAGLVSSPSM